jgi:hypothetical protein
MTSHELAKLLLDGPDVVVIVQKDAEGNDYSPLKGADNEAWYAAESTWSGIVYGQAPNFPPGVDADEEDFEDEDETPADAVPCVVLFPVN